MLDVWRLTESILLEIAREIRASEGPRTHSEEHIYDSTAKVLLQDKFLSNKPLRELGEFGNLTN